MALGEVMMLSVLQRGHLTSMKSKLALASSLLQCRHLTLCGIYCCLLCCHWRCQYNLSIDKNDRYDLFNTYNQYTAVWEAYRLYDCILRFFFIHSLFSFVGVMVFGIITAILSLYHLPYIPCPNNLTA